ncbi:MAG: DUF952 domain-containing protein [Pseudomonadota bacterium]
MIVYKLFRGGEWDALVRDGQTRGAPVDLADGYIHFSTADQVAETAAKHFTGVSNLVIAAVDADALGDDLRWEPSRGGQLFPHLYRGLNRRDILWARPAPLGTDGVHVLQIKP